MTPEQISALIAAHPDLAPLLLAAYKALPSGTASVQSVYGTGGLLALGGVRNPVISAVQIPQNTLAKRLPSRTTNILNELVAYVTEATGTAAGSEPAGPCDDPPVAGGFKTATVAAPLGRYSRQSGVIDLSAQGLYLNRCVQPLDFVGGLGNDNPLVPTGLTGGTQDMVRNAYAMALSELGLAFVRLLGPQIWRGNPTNNNVGGGYKEFKGLDLWINTGYVDSVTSTAAPTLDSDVRAFGGANIGTAPNGATLVATLVNMVRNLRKRAEDIGLSPVKLAFAMRWATFQAITEVWPCSFLTYRCGPDTTAGTPITMSATELDTYRKEMRSGPFLWVDGEKIEVIIDDFILETRPDAVAAPNDYQSDIYLLPMSYAGNRAGIYLEFVDFAAPNGLIEAAKAFAPTGSYVASDGGRFVIHKKPVNNFCAQILGLTLPRLLLEVPHLAGRLTGVRYSTMKHEASAIIGEPTYIGGGVSSR